jgi:hypothetical protein
MNWTFSHGGWDGLARELAAWGRTGSVATFWWRDDDAVDAAPQLERLLAAARGTPLALAVIPALATPALAARLEREPQVSVLQHGWRHRSYAPKVVNEYPPHRERAEVAAELAAGRTRLVQLFGSRALRVFVPPAHAFDESFLSLLTDSGLRTISQMGERGAREAASGLTRTNVHVAPIEWSSPPSFRSDGRYLARIVQHLRRRRLGMCDATEPTGLLTHHLDQDARSWDFIERLAASVAAHPAAAWLDPPTALGEPPAAGSA